MNLMRKLETGIVLGDGALGTYLADKLSSVTPASGNGSVGTVEGLAIDNPSLLASVHMEYIQAGSMLIETNTFTATPLSPSEVVTRMGWENLCRASVDAAKEAIGGKDLLIAGAIGPAPMGYTAEECVDAGIRQAEVLLSSGCHAILLESFWDLRLLEMICKGIKGMWDIPIIAQISLDSRFVPILKGWETTLASLQSEGLAEVVGLNCARGPEGILHSVKALTERTPGFVSAYPNASLPYVDGGRVVYGSDIRDFAKGALDLAKAGARLIGGCCGTTPDHIRVLRDLLEHGAGTDAAEKPKSNSPSAVRVRIDQGLQEPQTRETQKVAGNKHPFDSIVELTPPKDSDLTEFLQKATALSQAGCNAFSITENPLAIPRVGTLAAAHLVQEATGVPCIIHMTCRDRNIVGQRSHLLAAHALGLRHVLAMTGDPLRDQGTITDGRSSSGVFDTNSMGLIQLISGLDGLFTVGAVMNANARNLSAETDRLKRKMELGAVFVQTQPVFSEAGLYRLKEAVQGLGLRIYPGIMPLKSFRNASFLNREFPGISIPEEIMEALAETPETGQREVGMSLAASLASKAADLFGGVYLVAHGLEGLEVSRILTGEDGHMAGVCIKAGTA